MLRDNFTLEDLDFLLDELQRIAKGSQGQGPLHRQLQRWVQMEYEADVGGDGVGEVFGRGSFGRVFEMGGKLEEMRRGKKMDEVICRVCHDVPVGAVITEVSEECAMGRGGWC